MSSHSLNQIVSHRFCFANLLGAHRMLLSTVKRLVIVVFRLRNSEWRWVIISGLKVVNRSRSDMESLILEGLIERWCDILLLLTMLIRLMLVWDWSYLECIRCYLTIWKVRLHLCWHLVDNWSTLILCNLLRESRLWLGSLVVRNDVSNLG